MRYSWIIEEEIESNRRVYNNCVERLKTATEWRRAWTLAAMEGLNESLTVLEEEYAEALEYEADWEWHNAV